MPTLQEILEFAKSKDACRSQLNPFKKFLESGDKLSAWQTVLGNIEWLRKKGLEIDQMFLEKNAQGIGKVWNYDLLLWEYFTYKEGKKDGLYQCWHPNGQLFVSCTFKDGNLDGFCQSWHSDGKVIYSRSFKQGIIV